MGDERRFAGDDHDRSSRAHPSSVDPVSLIRRHGRAGGWGALELIEDQIRDAARTGLDVLVSGADRDLRAALAEAVHGVGGRRAPLVALGPGHRDVLRALADAVAAGEHPAEFPEGVGTLYLDDVGAFDLVQQNLVSDFLERRISPGTPTRGRHPRPLRLRR